MRFVLPCVLRLFWGKKIKLENVDTFDEILQLIKLWQATQRDVPFEISLQ